MEIPISAEKIFSIGSFNITNSLLMSWVVITTLIIIAILVGKNIKMIPNRFQAAVELIIEGADNLIYSLAGKKGRFFLPLLLTFFLFILTANWMGLLPFMSSIGFYEIHHEKKIFIPLFRAGTSDLNLTLALGLISVIATQFYGLKYRGLYGYIKHYFHNPLQGSMVFIVSGIIIGAFVGILEIISEFVKIVSLSFRLFGNIFAGEAVLTTVSGIAQYFAPIPFLMLETLVGVVQAAVFSLLTLVFISIITNKPEEAH